MIKLSITTTLEKNQLEAYLYAIEVHVILVHTWHITHL